MHGWPPITPKTTTQWKRRGCCILFDVHTKTVSVYHQRIQQFRVKNRSHCIVVKRITIIIIIYIIIKYVEMGIPSFILIIMIKRRRISIAFTVPLTFSFRWHTVSCCRLCFVIKKSNAVAGKKQQQQRSYNILYD